MAHPVVKEDRQRSKVTHNAPSRTSQPGREGSAELAILRSDGRQRLYLPVGYSPSTGGRFQGSALALHCVLVRVASHVRSGV
jgi:hypothetical protein